MKKSKKIRGTMTRTRRVLTLALLFTLSMLSLTSCEAIRTVTTTSQYTTQDDGKNVIIETKTTESYLGQKKS